MSVCHRSMKISPSVCSWTISSSTLNDRLRITKFKRYYSRLAMHALESILNSIQPDFSCCLPQAWNSLIPFSVCLPAWILWQNRHMLFEIITLVKLNGMLQRDAYSFILPSADPCSSEGSGVGQWLHLAVYLMCWAVSFWVCVTCQCQETRICFSWNSVTADTT